MIDSRAEIEAKIARKAPGETADFGAAGRRAADAAKSVTGGTDYDKLISFHSEDSLEEARLARVGP